MRSKMIFVFFCTVVLLAVVHSQEPSPDEAKKYSQCYKYAVCEDPAALKKYYTCYNALSEQGLQEYLKYLKKFFPFKSDDLSGIVKEYCSYGDAEKKKIYKLAVDADYSDQKNTDQKSIESGLEQLTECLFKLLKEVQSEGKCSTD